MSESGNGTPTAVRVLYIEDNDDDAVLCRRLLNEEGFSVERARGVDEAAHRLSTGGLDVVLLDLRLPGTSGVATLRAVRNFTDLPIIVLSGAEDTHTVLESVKAGARDYFVKGRTDRRALQDAIRGSVDWWRMIFPNPSPA